MLFIEVHKVVAKSFTMRWWSGKRLPNHQRIVMSMVRYRLREGTLNTNLGKRKTNVEQPLAIFSLEEIDEIIQDAGFKPGTPEFCRERGRRFRPAESTTGFVEKEHPTAE